MYSCSLRVLYCEDSWCSFEYKQPLSLVPEGSSALWLLCVVTTQQVGCSRCLLREINSVTHRFALTSYFAASSKLHRGYLDLCLIVFKIKNGFSEMCRVSLRKMFSCWGHFDSLVCCWSLNWFDFMQTDWTGICRTVGGKSSEHAASLQELCDSLLCRRHEVVLPFVLFFI